MNKLYTYGSILILIVISGWYIVSIIEENGQLTQSNATLKKSVEDSEKENKKLKAVAELNAATVAKVSEQKNVLNIYALKIANDLEMLKNENEDIKKWAINYIPFIIATRLLNTTNNEPNNGLLNTPGAVVETDTRTEIKVRNENLYNYAIEMRAAVRSCNADKIGLREWYQSVGIILNNGDL